MSKIGNVILMLEYLSTGRKYSIQELSDLLEVSPRMIRIYKDELEKAGVFVDTLKGIYGGYVLNQHMNIPYLLFDNNDIFIIEDNELNVYNKLNRAIRNHHKVRIRYYNLQHGESIRTIYPLGMYLFQEEWWCSSYWEEKDDMRQFHIKRILDCEILAETFDPKKINIKF